MTIDDLFPRQAELRHIRAVLEGREQSTFDRDYWPQHLETILDEPGLTVSAEEPIWIEITIPGMKRRAHAVFRSE